MQVKFNKFSKYLNIKKVGKSKNKITQIKLDFLNYINLGYLNF